MSTSEEEQAVTRQRGVAVRPRAPWAKVEAGRSQGHELGRLLES